MSNDQRNPKPEYRTLRRSGTALSSFGFQYSFGFRDSSSDLETAGHEEPPRHFAVRWVDEPGPTPPQPPFRLRQGSGGQVGHLLPHRGVRVYRAEPRVGTERGIYPAGTPAPQTRVGKSRCPFANQSSSGLKPALLSPFPARR